MKKLMILFSILIALIYSSYAQIPNGGFESWATDIDNNLNPVGWETINSSPEISVSQFTPAYAGNFSMKVEPFNAGFVIIPGFAMINFPYTSRPTNFKACIKADIMSGDAVYIIMALRQGDSVIAAGASSTLLIDSSINNFTCFTFPIMYQSTLTPDTATITIMAGSSSNVQVGTEIIVDELSFDFSTDVTELTTQAMASLGQNIPNPAIGSTDFPLILNNGSETVLHLFDFLGKEVKTTPFGFLEAGNHNIHLSVDELSPGVYYCNIVGNNFTLSKKIIVL